MERERGCSGPIYLHTGNSGKVNAASLEAPSKRRVVLKKIIDLDERYFLQNDLQQSFEELETAVDHVYDLLNDHMKELILLESNGKKYIDIFKNLSERHTVP